jgi:hypothetical protein
VQPIQAKSYDQFFLDECVYNASFAVTVVALGALRYSISFTYFFCTGALGALLHAKLFSQAVDQREVDHFKVKRWQTVACTVSAAFMIVQISYFIPQPSMKLQDLLYVFLFENNEKARLCLSKTLGEVQLFIISALVGSRLAKQCYTRGKELAKMKTWEPMRLFLSSQDAEPRLNSFLDQCRFAAGIVNPQVLWSEEPLMKLLYEDRIQPLLCTFLSDEGKKVVKNALIDRIDQYVEMAEVLKENDSEAEDRLRREKIMATFHYLDSETQWELLPHIAIKIRNVWDELPRAICQRIQQRYADIINHSDKLLEKWQEQKSDLEAQILGYKEGDNLNSIHRSWHQLSQTVEELHLELNVYCAANSQNCNPFGEMFGSLKKGVAQCQLEQLINSKLAANEGLAEKDSVLECFYAFSSWREFFPKLAKLLKVQNNPNAIEQRLRELSIDQKKEFIRLILKGDLEKLESSKCVLDAIREYTQGQPANELLDILIKKVAKVYWIGRWILKIKIMSFAPGYAVLGVFMSNSFKQLRKIGNVFNITIRLCFMLNRCPLVAILFILRKLYWSNDSYVSSILDMAHLLEASMLYPRHSSFSSGYRTFPIKVY